MKCLTHLLYAIFFISALFISESVKAQCPLSCFNQLYVSLDASGNATLTPEIVLTDVPITCGTLVLSQSSFDCTDIGAPIIVFVTDTDSGNSCWSTIIIEDKIAPSIACIANLNIALPPSGTVDLTPAMLLAFENDNCPLTYEIVPPTVDCSDLGVPVNVVITATDPGGNSASCFTTVSVSNYNPPPLVCNAQVNISLGSTGQATILPEYILNTPYPECALLVTPNMVDCSDIGTPVTVIILDQITGNSCWSTVIVEDKLPPSILCAGDITVTLPQSGILDLTSGMLIVSENDNCPLTYNISPSTVSCDDLDAPVNVTITATDPGGNFQTCFTTVNVEYGSPTLTCVGQLNITLDANGEATITPEDLIVGPYPMCAVAISQNTFDCSDIGLPVFVTVIDWLNANTCSSIVNVEYGSPTLTCVGQLNITLDANGEATITPEDLIVGPYPMCAVAISQNTFDCSDIGLPVFVTVIDWLNANTCSSIVNVEDKLSPTPICAANINISLGSDGTATLLPEDVNVGSYDNCTSAANLTYSLSQSVFTCSDIGAAIPVEMHVTDESGNSDFCIAIVTVEDKLSPTPICAANINISLGSDGTATLLPENVNVGSYDNCTSAANLTYSLSQSVFTCSDIGAAIPVEMHVTDESGNSDFCIAIVTVEDKLSPTPICAANINISLGSDGTATLLPEVVNVGSYDNCTSAANLTYSLSQSVFTCSDIGAAIPVEMHVTDESGNSDFCIAIVTVEDKLSPTPICAANINISLGSDGTATLLPENVNVGSYDNCTSAANLTYSLSQSVFTCSDIGAAIPVEMHVTDESGNSDFCIAIVTVEDKLSPTPICAANINISLGSDGTATLLPEVVNVGSYDNCTSAANLIYSLSQSVFTCSDIGAAIPVEMHVTDESGNSDFCIAIVTVEDKLSPTPICAANINISLGSDGTATLLPENVNVGSYDNCTSAANLTYSLSQSVFTCSDIGAAIPVEMHVTDESGNTDFCIAIVTVEDKLSPTPICSANINISLGSDGTATLLPEVVNVGSYDNCTSAANLTYSLSQSVFTCSDIGAAIPVEMHVTDESGNTDFCIAIVTVEDKLSPTPICAANINISLGSDGTATLLPEVVNVGSYDNCTSAANLTYSLSQSVFTCSDIGAAIPVELHVTDESGNTDFCIAIVTVEDKLAPVLSCTASTTNIQLGADGTVTVTSDMVLDSASDNCDFNFSFSPAIFDCGDKNKTKNVIVTATDNSGNFSSCSGSVFIEDPQPSSVAITPPPSIICGQSGAVFSANITGGYGPFIYEWTIKGNPNGWSITSGQGTPSITMDVGIKKIKLLLEVTDLCGKKKKTTTTFSCSNPESGQAENVYELPHASNDFDIDDNASILVYPNPVMDRVEIQLNGQWTASAVHIYVLDQLGAKTSIRKKVESVDRIQQLDVSDLNPGIYCLVVETKDKNKIVKRFVKL